MPQKIIQIIQIGSSILFMLLVLVQNRGVGLSEIFGGSNAFYSTKRGAEKVVSVSTVVLAVIFVVSSLLTNFIK